VVTHPTVVANLSAEDLQRWRTWYARDCAIEVSPTSYSRDEIEEHYRQRMSLVAEFIGRYDLADSPRLSISDFTGVVYYQED
jgi:hypothetical protein